MFIMQYNEKRVFTFWTRMNYLHLEDTLDLFLSLSDFQIAGLLTSADDPEQTALTATKRRIPAEISPDIRPQTKRGRAIWSAQSPLFESPIKNPDDP